MLRAGRSGVLLLWLGLGLTAGPTQAAPPQDIAAPPAGAATAIADPQAMINALLLRIEGIEGKLRDSAAARKAADQARMVAERSLAEMSQGLARQEAEIAELRADRTALEGRLAGALEKNAAGIAALAAAHESNRLVTSERDALAVQVATLGREAEAAAALRRREAAAGQSLADGLAADLALARAERRAGDSALEQIQAELAATRRSLKVLSERLDAVRATVPFADGGSLTLEQAQAQAAAAALELREALAMGEQRRDGPSRRAVREAEQDLHRRQFSVARVSAARSVYRVRSTDTLAEIASRFYGDGSRWDEIHAANRHVLSDPDQLTPGISLVIP